MNMRTASLLVVGSILSGCVSYYPTDISVVSIEVVNYRDQAELYGGDHSLEYVKKAQWERGDKLITEADLENFYDVVKLNNAWPETQPNRLMLKVTFQSKEDLIVYKVDNRFSLVGLLYICHGENYVASMRYLWNVFWRGVNLSRLFDLSVVSVQRDRVTQSIKYYTYAWATNEETTPFFGPYDLRTSPGDVCLQVQGSSAYNFSKYYANVVVIPREAIAEALKTLPPPFNAETPPDVPPSD